ncbi:hypothetical protein C5Y96_25265 [Blastopirellula marina]|uniref:Uncharacterized protein n=1 Tax=Blastopirellula marina TaxID=124 RepID=A0A2S8EZ88_9BACT|nr:hypothetical protein C5Y96_25265 [Blastopirellula marina]RCS41651.1 hypothetical protein DTL36_25315 [Bremerella cremea]
MLIILAYSAGFNQAHCICIEKAPFRGRNQEKGPLVIPVDCLNQPYLLQQAETASQQAWPSAQQLGLASRQQASCVSQHASPNVQQSAWGADDAAEPGTANAPKPRPSANREPNTNLVIIVTSLIFKCR